MIDGLRQKLAKTMAKEDPWDADQELVQESEFEELTELPTDRAVTMGATDAVLPPSGHDLNTADYYKSIVKAAIEHGGRYNGHKIPIPWLRMVQAGLEYHKIETEQMWEGMEGADSKADSRFERVPAYDDMFSPT
jgi:hypothetical protein